MISTSNIAPSAPLAISNVSVADGGEIEEAPPDCCDVSPSETMTCDIMPTICEDPGAITGKVFAINRQCFSIFNTRVLIPIHDLVFDWKISPRFFV